MDDAPRAGLKASVLAAGLLVFLGGGCRQYQSTEAQSSTSTPINQVTDKNTPLVEQCFDDLDDLGAFQKTLDQITKDRNGTGPDLIPTLQEKQAQGWKIVKLCVQPQGDSEEASRTFFVLQKFQNITDKDVRAVAKQLPATAHEKLTTKSFSGSFTWSLIELGYSGSLPPEENEPFVVGTLLSDPVAAKGSMKEPAVLKDLGLILGDHDLLARVTVEAGYPDVYQEHVDFSTMNNKLK